MRIVKPFEVRVWFKNYLTLLAKYQEREATNTFNKCGLGSESYYWRAIEQYRKKLTQFGHLLTSYN